jgi:hypothetical protein
MARSLLGFLAALLLTLGALVAPTGGAAAAAITIPIDQQNGSGISGTATLTDLGNGQTRVEIAVTGFQGGTPSPAHIHLGTCATLNPAVLYPLTDVVGGKSTTVVNVTTAALLAQPQAINIHKSAQEATVYVACGTIAAQSPTGMPSTGGGGMAQRPTVAPWALVAISGAALLAALGLLRRRTPARIHARDRR